MVGMAWRLQRHWGRGSFSLIMRSAAGHIISICKGSRLCGKDMAVPCRDKPGLLWRRKLADLDRKFELLGFSLKKKTQHVSEKSMDNNIN
jgi:hypothetical protein